MASNPNNATTPPLEPTPESIIQELDISKFIPQGEEPEPVLATPIPPSLISNTSQPGTPETNPAPVPAEQGVVQKPLSPTLSASAAPASISSPTEKGESAKPIQDQPSGQQSPTPTTPTSTPSSQQTSQPTQNLAGSAGAAQTQQAAIQQPPSPIPSPTPISAAAQPPPAQGQGQQSPFPQTAPSIVSASPLSPPSASSANVPASTTPAVTPTLTPTPTAPVAKSTSPTPQAMQTPSSQAPLTPPQSHSPVHGQSASPQRGSVQTPPPRPPQSQPPTPPQPPTLSPKGGQGYPPRQSPPPAQSLPSIQSQLQSHPLSPGPQAPIQTQTIPPPVPSPQPGHSQPPPSPQPTQSALPQVPSPQPGQGAQPPPSPLAQIQSQGPQTPSHQSHTPVQLTPIQSHPLSQQGTPPQQPPSPLHHLGGSHLPHPQLHAQQGPIQPTPQSTTGNAPPSPVLPPMQSPASQPPSSQSIPPTLPAAPIQPIQTIQAIPIPTNQQHQVPQQGQPMQHQIPHQLPHPMHSPMQHQMQQPMHMGMQQTPPSLPSPQGQRGVSPTPYILPQPARQIKFENALEFLDQVKLQFSKQPRVYNQFLDIMKDFKAQFIDTPGVIARVSELFKGHKHLILGFNTFLPPGYKIEIPDDDKPPQVIQPPPPSHPPMQAAPQPPAPAPPAGGRKQPEFDHARTSYVKKIKTRFQHQPTVYKSFLDILHAYHKEQHTIKDVYDQVANLFANHADLLEEFTQFLPDPVASQNNAMGGGGGAIPPPISPTAQVPQPQRGVKGGRASRVPQKKPMPAAPPSPEKEKPSGRGAKRGPARRADDNMPSKRATHDREDYYGGPASPPVTPSAKDDDMPKNAPEGSFEELDFFNRVKSALGNPKLYHEFLKCLNLYSQEIISRVELVLLVKDLLSRYPDLFDWFKHFIGFDEASMELLEKKEAMALEDNRQPWSEIDYSTCKRYGPSYRALPANYGTPRCSGRTELCWGTLNDIWVSVPTGSEDFTFKNQRKNQYEEVLFKCEDERYELDLVIELNTSAIRALEPIKAKLAALTEEEASVFKMDPLDPLHARSIERIYGDKGAEILEGVYANPSIAVPIVLQRLKQKDFEWHKSKQEWDKVWREITAKNYHKSLDHQSFFFKQAEKKTLSPKVLLAEIKQQFADKLREQQEESKENRRNKGVVKKEVVPWHLQYSFTDPQVFQEISDLILFAAEKLLSRADKEKIDTFLKHFLGVFFRVEDIYKQTSEAPLSMPSITSPPPTTPPSTDKPAEKEKEEEKEKAIPATPPTPNLAASSGDLKMEAEGDKKDSVMEDAKETETKPEPIITSVSTPPIAPEGETTAPAESAPSSENKEGQEKEGEKEKEKEKEAAKEKVDDDKVKRIRKIFFGNNSFYVFFRLYQIMYDRLAKGKELAEISKKSKWNSRPIRIPKANGEAEAEGREREKEKEKEREREENEKDRYSAFLEKLYSLLAGAMDLSHYEDECRSLLGISSYVLFTMDKLVVQVTRHLQALLSNEPCAKLLSLFMYETVRPQGMLENVYHAGCAELLRDERMFLFEFEQIPNPGRFTLQLLDSNSQPLPKFMEFNFEPNKYSEYVASFQKDSSKIDPRKHHVFMVRNQKEIRDRPDSLQGVTSSNNLECRICLSTYRLFYVEDTEDFFYRPLSSRPPRKADKPAKERKINFEKLKINPPSADDAMKVSFSFQ